MTITVVEFLVFIFNTKKKSQLFLYYLDYIFNNMSYFIFRYLFK